MAEDVKSELLETPIYEFVKRHWKKWSQEIVKVQVCDKDFLLFLLWALDLIKDPDTNDDQLLWDEVFDGLRNYFIDHQHDSNKDDMNYLTILVCAAALSCYGLTLRDNYDNQAVFCKLVSELGNHWEDVKQMKHNLNMDTNVEGLQEWMIEYIASDSYYTSTEKIKWEINMAEQLIKFKKKNKKVTQVDLYRVIMALYKLDAFEAIDGSELTEITVFQAFANILGDNFDDFNNRLSIGSTNQTEPKIFSRLVEGFEEYEAEKDNKLEKQGKKSRR